MKKVIAICLLAALASCNASKKSVTKKQSVTDSTVTEKSTAIRSATLDMEVKKTDQSTFTKITETGFKAIEIDSIYPPLGVLANGAFVIKSPNKGKQTLMVPTSTTAETGLNNIETHTRLQRKDTAAVAAEKTTTLRKEERIIERKKISIGFNFWWLLLLIPLILLSPAVRKKITSIFKFILP